MLYYMKIVINVINVLKTLIDLRYIQTEPKLYIPYYIHTLSPNFFRGVSDQNENLVGKFFARLWRAKKGVRKFFACGGLFSLWRH